MTNDGGLSTSENHVIEESGSTLVPTHPLEIKPLGNAYTAEASIKEMAGLFAPLPDDLITQIIDWLLPTELLRLGGTCKALYAFSRQEELWKSLLLRFPPSLLKWQGSWQSTWLGVQKQALSQISCQNLFSDTLYRPFLCSSTTVLPYAKDIPYANAISRLSDLKADDFVNHWTEKPFILTEPVRQWPAYKNWSTSHLLEYYGDIAFRAEAVDWPFRVYVDYMNNNDDESPLYLFDSSFVEKMSLKVGKEHENSYWIPPCFGEDLFDLLENQRPDRRWLIVGPERSGSTFHKDPNATSAWNAVLRGSKYWIMFPTTPSSPPPPGVYVSQDQSEVTSPLSIAEWLLGFHAEARKTHGCKEGICREGEVLHVPSGWWHLVVNLESSIAITQNFVPRVHLANALAFLKDKPEQVSGFKSDVSDPYALFVARLQEKHPELLQEGLKEVENLQAHKKRKWDELVAAERGEGFAFGFGDGDDGDVP
ncbi:MAG: hypothetical protein Q9219_000263 [cf. Caloplaca sp. 3 TL-2023]